jgi:ferredoxin
MAYVIAQPCIGTKDTACVAVCPVDCIHPTKDEAAFAEAQMLYIDPDTCIDCNLCVDECPVTAIFPQDELPAEWTCRGGGGGRPAAGRRRLRARARG